MGKGERPPESGPSRARPPRVTRNQTSPTAAFLSRFAAIALCLGLGFASCGLGRNILKTGVYDYSLIISHGDSRPAANEANVRRQDVRATGDWAREQGIAFVAMGITFALWGFLMIWGMLGPFALRPTWSPLHSLLALVSLACFCTATVFYFPPWRISSSSSCIGFYIVMAAIVYLATLRDSDKVKSHGQKIFQPLLVSAVLIGGYYSSGYGIGIVLGIFFGLVLATHVMVLVPSLRAKVWRPAKPRWGWSSR